MTVTRQKIIGAAFELTENGGMEAATMRRIAQSLGIRPPSLYWHFASRQALFDAMADHMIDGIECDPRPGEGWRDHLDRIAHKLRDAMLARRDGGRIFAGTYPATLNVVRIAEPCLMRMSDAGLARQKAVWALFSLVHFVIGAVIEQQARMGTRVVEARAVAAPHKQYVAFEQAWPEIGQDDPDARFEFGLAAMLGGISSQIAP